MSERLKPKPKMETVANAVGVSVSTVSRALRDDPRITREIRNRVMMEARRLGYQNLRRPGKEDAVASARQESAASSPDNKLRKLLTILLQPAPRDFYAEALFELLEQTRRSNIVMQTVECTGEHLAEHIVNAEAAGWDAALVITLAGLRKEQAQALAKRQMPIVLINRHVEGCTNAVTLDDFAAGVHAARYLTSLGHRLIAHLPGGMEYTSLRERAAGFRTGLELLGCFHPELFTEPLHGDVIQWTHRNMQRLLNLPSPPTAVWAFSDIVASAALITVRAAGIEVPRDISIMGFDNRSEFREVGLTTFDYRFGDMIRHALYLLEGLLRGDLVGPVRICLAPTLLEKLTTGPAPAASRE